MVRSITRPSGLELTQVDDRSVAWQYQSDELGLLDGRINYNPMSNGWLIYGLTNNSIDVLLDSPPLVEEAVEILEREIRTLEQTTPEVALEKHIKDQFNELFGN